MLNLNQNAARLCRALIERADHHRIAVHTRADGGVTVDLGIEARGGLQAGLALAEICMAGLGRVDLVPCDKQVWDGPAVMVRTDHPVAACMASQYAGWKVSSGKYFAMGSGPMRIAAAKEELFSQLKIDRQTADEAVGVLETRTPPPPEACLEIARQCGTTPDKLTLLIAPTASQAGTVQIVARSVETSLHKLLELGFDLSRVESGFGTAPLPPAAKDDLAGIGRTNDAVLYGAEVTLWVRGDDASLEHFGPRVPSSGSRDHGRPFAEIFKQYEYDFYKIDPHLFSPAVITLVNMDTGGMFRFGRACPDVLKDSFST